LLTILKVGKDMFVELHQQLKKAVRQARWKSEVKVARNSVVIWRPAPRIRIIYRAEGCREESS
jgi:hypothetical protein